MSLTLIARCVRGIEWILADEVARTEGTSQVRLGEREVTFTAARLTPRLLELRTADDLFLDIGTVSGLDHTRAALGLLPARLARLDVAGAVSRLGELRPLGRKPRFDVVASLAGKRNYNRYAVEDTAGAALGRVLGPGYVSRTPSATPAAAGGGQPRGPQPELTVRLFLRGEQLQAALRVAGRPLHRRAWKEHTGAGTLHPPMAAALARIARLPEGGTLLDPFCGDGTVAIELALLDPAARVVAADLDRDRLANTRANAASAGARLLLLRADAARSAVLPGTVDQIVTNPPWNRAVGAAGAVADGLDPLWRELPRLFGPRGRMCLIAEAELDTPGQLRRRGYTVDPVQNVRLAGRVSQILVAAPPGVEPLPLDAELLGWRQRAIKQGVLSHEGF
ncbi:TRM11 family SAM-dependent methyltransferase [Streptomyces polygonati]|uniref:TRM11 family SAM-dependent methyltransferase n=1 Tax=Streptomyces polygonati TaxID=1617087 RepID=A0ABV8HNF8_9ACTN